MEIKKILTVPGFAKRVGLSRQQVHSLVTHVDRFGERKLEPDFVDDSGQYYFVEKSVLEFQKRNLPNKKINKTPGQVESGPVSNSYNQ